MKPIANPTNRMAAMTAHMVGAWHTLAGDTAGAGPAVPAGESS